MPQRTLRFKIRQDGLVEESVSGMAGQSCHELTENLEESLGVVQRRESKPEFYLSQETQAQSVPVQQQS